MFRKKQIQKEFNSIELLPENLRSRLAIFENALCISEEIKNEYLVLEFFQNLKSKGTVSEYKIYKSVEFSEKFKRTSLNFIETSNEIQSLAKDLFQSAMNINASDIHIKDMGTHCLIRFRAEGLMHDHLTIEAVKGRELIQAIYNTMCQSADSQYSYSERQDARIVNDIYLPKGMHSIRVHTEPTEKKDGVQGIGTCMFNRLLYDAIKVEGSLQQRLSKLGFLDSQIEIFNYIDTKSGLCCISGPTGSGKSTALKHVMESSKNARPYRSYMSVEDPPEFHLEGIDQIAVKTRDVLNRGQAYVDAIAGAMRSDPDCILIGEMRYAEAIQAALNAAMSGHAVWSTIHASDAMSIVLRMVTILSEKGSTNAIEHICEPNVLSGLEYQRLIPQLCPHCSKPLASVINSYDKTMLEKVKRALKGNIDNVRVRGEGCLHCNHIGVKGQQVAAEIIATNATFLDFMKKRKFQEARRYWLTEQKGISHVTHALMYLEQGKADPFLTEDRLGLPLDYEVKRK